MRLSSLLEKIPFKSKNWIDLEIENVSIDSRTIKPNEIFIAWKGINLDTHAFIPIAIKNGAIAIVSEKNIEIDKHCPLVIVKSSREAYSQMMQNFFHRPGDQLKLIGITGTTGKTTIAFLIFSILNELNIKTGLIGTAGYYCGKHKLDEMLQGPVTTPEPYELNRLLFHMKKNLCQAVIMEASSFGLDQKRIYGLSFDQAILSNLSYNHHINYHKGIREYISSKELLFNQVKQSGIAIMNADTEYFELFHSNAEKKFTIGTWNTVDFQIKEIHSKDCNGIFFTLIHGKESYKIESPLVGDFQAYNLSIAFVACINLGLNPQEISQAILKIKSIPGRWQFIKTKLPISILVDKANTPIALDGILPLIENFHCQNKILVFGNVGGGDSKERRMMAKSFYKAFDKIILTTDDPEDEDPMDGINDFLTGIPGYDTERIIIELDRRKAIKLAVCNASPSDLVAILGRGNQREFINKGKVFEFDDTVVVKEILEELEN